MQPGADGTGDFVTLAAAGFDTTGLEWRAKANADGAGAVRLVISAAAAHDLGSSGAGGCSAGQGQLSQCATSVTRDGCRFAPWRR